MEDDFLTEFDIATQLFYFGISTLDILVGSPSQHLIIVTLGCVFAKQLSNANLMINLLVRGHIVILSFLFMFLGFWIMRVGNRFACTFQPIGPVLQNLVNYGPLLKLNLVIHDTIFTQVLQLG